MKRPYYGYVVPFLFALIAKSCADILVANPILSPKAPIHRSHDVLHSGLDEQTAAPVPQ